MKTVLIIEDDPKVAAALRVRFEGAGYAAAWSGDALTGWARAVETRPDLVLLDVALPAGDGLQLARKLRETPELSRTPFIFITGDSEPGLRGQAMALNAAGFFEKPYDAEELLAVAQYALGDTVCFRRPAATAEEPPAVAREKRILIIEDDERIASALAIRLRGAGYQVATAPDALSGVSAAVREHPDLVLLDIGLPAGNGFGVAGRVRALLPQDTPIVFLTASKQPGLREKASALGAAGFFEKPYEPEELLAAVGRAVRPG
jgi:DNA-binding response OmpR family regulator